MMLLHLLVSHYINCGKSVNGSTSELRKVLLKQHVVPTCWTGALFIQPRPDTL